MGKKYFWSPGDWGFYGEYYFNLSWFDKNGDKKEYKLTYKKINYKNDKRKIRWFNRFIEEGEIPLFIDIKKLKKALKKGAYSNEMYALMREYKIINY